MKKPSSKSERGTTGYVTSGPPPLGGIIFQVFDFFKMKICVS